MKKLFYLFLLLLANNLLLAQSDIVVTISINPPYSPYLSTYVDQPNKVLLTLTNTNATADSLKLWVKISGDNGVSVTTAAGFNPSEPIVLAGYETKMISFNSEETRDYFDAGHVDLVGITKSQLIQNQALPEGNYQICIRALGFALPHVLKSMDACASFPLFYIDPPIAIQPTCGNDVLQTTPQFVLFSWTPPATAEGLINYEFTLKEVPNTLNPNDVIKNNVFPVLFNTTQTSNTTLVYGIDKPQLEAGKNYVWRVKAVDPNNTVQFKNSGFSEACSFKLTPQPTYQLIDSGNNTINVQTNGGVILKLPENNSITDALLSSNTSNVPDHYHFEWKPAPVMTATGAMVQANYRLRIAAVLPGQTPSQALKIDSQVTEKAVTSTFYDYTKLSDFVPGQTYAWEVKYVQSGTVKYFSEQWTFKVKKNYGKYKVSGKIDYCYSLGTNSWSHGTGKIVNNIPFAQQDGSNIKPCPPYKNAMVAFYKAILVKEGNSQVVAMDGTTLLQLNQQLGGNNNYFKDAGELAGIAFTDENGHFDFATDDILGKIFDTTANGKTYNYYKALKVTLGPYGSTYFNNPDEYLVLEGGQAKEQNFHARVKTFKLRTKFIELPTKNYYNKTQPVETLSHKITVYVLREKHYPAQSSPANEGMTDQTGNEQLTVSIWGGFLTQTYSVISKITTHTGATVTFNDLVLNDVNNPNDKFILYATAEGKTDPIMFPQEFRNTDQSVTNCTFGWDDLTFQSSSDWQKAYNKNCYVKNVTLMPNMMISSSLSGRLVSHWNHDPGSPQNNKPDLGLANTKVKLMAYLVKQKDDGTEEVIKTSEPELFDVAYTDDNGNFKFDVNIYSDSSKFHASTLLGSYDLFGGTITRVLRVVVENPNYLSPDNSFVIDGGYNYDVGTLQCYVRDATMSVKITDDTPQEAPIANQRVYLCRWDGWTDGYIPKDEGMSSSVTVPKIYDKDGYEYRVVAEATTASDGRCSFNRLVAPGYEYITGYPEWPYFIHVQPDEYSTNNYLTPYPYETHFTYKAGFKNKITFNSEQPQAMLNAGFSVTCEALKPTIRGVVHPKSNMGFTTIDGAKVYLLYYKESDKNPHYKIIDALQNNTYLKNMSDAYAYLGLDYVQSVYHLHVYDMQITGADGKFSFENVPVKTLNTGENLLWMVWVEKNGFLTEVERVGGKDGTPLLKGQQFPLTMLLRLPKSIMCKVEDKDHPGMGVSSKIIVGNAYSWTQTKMLCNTQTGTCHEQGDTVRCPYGTVKLYVYPIDQTEFLPDSFEIKINDDVMLIGPLQLRPRKHSLAFIAKDKYTNVVVSKISAQLVGVYGWQFTGTGVSQEPDKPNPATGIAVCHFKSSATDFTFQVWATATNGQPYTPKMVSVHSDPQFTSSTIITIAKLEPASIFTGYVKTNSGIPVQGAHVYVDEMFCGGAVIDATTDASGKYTLIGVPLKQGVIIHATKPNSNYVGDKVRLTFKGGVQGEFKILPTSFNYNCDFKLKDCPLDIAKLLGFQIEATDMLQTIGSTNIKLSGRFVNLPANNAIKPKESTNLNFSSIELKAGNSNGASGKPLAEPASLPLRTDEWFVPIKLYNWTEGTLVAPDFFGIQVDKKTTIMPGTGGGNGEFNSPTSISTGVIVGGVAVNCNSFSKGIKFNDPFFVARPKGAAKTEFDVFNSFGSVPVAIKNGFTVESALGKNIRFNLFNQYPDAEADKTTSTLKEGEILDLDTKIHTKLNNVDPEDAALPVGKINFRPTSCSDVINSQNLIKIPLGKWSVTSTDWRISPEGGLLMKTGKLNTAVSVPFNNMSLTYTDLMYGEFEFNNMTLGGIAPLAFKNDAIRTFGFDKGAPGGAAWSFLVLPGQNSTYCASFGELPGMGTQTQFYIKSIRTFSTIEAAKVDLKNDANPISIYNVATFSPGSMDAGSDNIAFIGAVDYKIPALSYNSNMKVMWKKTDTGTKLQLPEAPEFTMKTKGIVFHHAPSDGYTFGNNIFSLKGTLKDEKNSPNDYSFNVELTKTPNDISLNAIGANTFLYSTGSNRGLENIHGNMNVQGGEWSNFSFNGDMFGMNGGIKEGQKKVYMTVKGDIVADPNNAIGVTGIDMGLGKMNFVYDFNKQAFVGSSHVGSAIGGQHAEVDVELLIGSGQYYIAGSGEITFPPDFWIKKASSALFAGKVDNFPSTVSTMFSNFTYDHSKPTFLNGAYTGVAGAFGVKMPIPKVPQFQLDLDPIANMGIEHEISINAITSLNFANSATLDFTASACAYLRAYAGASIGIGCIHLEAAAKAGIAITGHLNSSEASITGSAELKLSGDGEIGVGCCDSDCDHPWYCPCVKGGLGVCFTGEIHAKYSTGSGIDMGSDGVGCSMSSCGNQMKCN